jgi:hypothetical protein
VTRTGTLSRYLARRLTGHAAQLLPESHAAWARAMCCEIEHIGDDRAALAWSLGCLGAAYSTRISAMRMGSLKTARPLLALEMLVCFVTLTAVFFAALSAVIAAGGRPPPLPGMLLAASALGPAGLLAALGPALLGAAPSRASIALLTGLGTLTLAACANGVLPTPSWRDAVLCVLLPFVAVAHLARLRSATVPPAVSHA